MAKPRRRRRPQDEYEQIWSGEWWTFDQPFDLACCHCSLVHGMYIRLHEGQVQVRMVENKAETERVRKADGISVTRKSQ